MVRVPMISKRSLVVLYFEGDVYEWSVMLECLRHYGLPLSIINKKIHHKIFGYLVLRIIGINIL